MNILITTCRGLGYGGAEITIQQFAQELQRRGHNIIIASSGDYPGLKTEKFKFVEKYPYFIQHAYLKNFIKKLIKKYSIRLITPQDRITTIPVLQAAQELSIPSVVHFRDYWFACPKSSCLRSDNIECKHCDWKSLLKCSKGKRYAIDLYKFSSIKKYWKLLDSADLKLVASTALKIKLANCGINKNIQLIQIPRKLDQFLEVTGVDEFKNQYNLKKIVIGFMGSFTYPKGVLQLFNYMTPILKNNPNTSLLMVGDGPLLNEIKELIKKENLNDQVVLTGRLPFEKIPLCYAASDILIMPHLWEEPFGAMILEAAAAGKPLIYSEKGGPADVRDQFGYTLSPYDTEIWKEKIQYLIDNPKVRKSIGKKSREKIKEYSVELYVDKLEKYYKELTST